MFVKKPCKANIAEYSGYVFEMVRRHVAEYVIIKDNQLHGQVITYWTRVKAGVSCHAYISLCLNGVNYQETEQASGGGIDLLAYSIGQMFFKLHDTLEANGLNAPAEVAIPDLWAWYSNNWERLLKQAGFNVIRAI